MNEHTSTVAPTPSGPKVMGIKLPSFELKTPMTVPRQPSPGPTVEGNPNGQYIPMPANTAEEATESSAGPTPTPFAPGYALLSLSFCFLPALPFHVSSLLHFTP